jgi:hypothetical protein
MSYLKSLVLCAKKKQSEILVWLETNCTFYVNPVEKWMYKEELDRSWDSYLVKHVRNLEELMALQWDKRYNVVVMFSSVLEEFESNEREGSIESTAW